MTESATKATIKILPAPGNPADPHLCERLARLTQQNTAMSGNQPVPEGEILDVIYIPAV